MPASQTFDIVAGALHRAASAVENAAPRQAEAARLIRLGRLDDAFPLVSECVGAWQEFQASLAGAAAAIAQPVEHLAALVLAPGSERPAAPLSRLAAILHTIKQSVLARDWVGLADSLEYDLGDLAQRWSKALLQPDDAESPPAAGTSGLSRSAPAA